ncbi:MAG TPA: thiopurine S-methyltransferase, partial [Fibrobacter sp.]|nr:thiopurine S-methyltransferase [Fibrobacter sp.]
MLTQNLPDFWDALYSEGKDYWNFKKATPALLKFFEHPSCPKTGSVLV